jgi:TRAP-type C4-dicarboxylate transport system permease small subunit
VSNESDGEEGASDKAAPEKQLEVPPTRPSRPAPVEEEPPIRQSAIQLMADPSLFPDDDPFAHRLREIDKVTGIVEQAILFGLLAVMILVAVIQTLATKLFGESFLWSFDVVRGTSFAIAMGGAALASRYASHLSMDVVSRILSRRNRLVLRVALGLVTIFAAALLLYSGLHVVEEKRGLAGDHTIPLPLLAAMIPIGSGLIIFHSLLHVLIDIDYLVRGKLPPEKVPTGH